GPVLQHKLNNERQHWYDDLLRLEWQLADHHGELCQCSDPNALLSILGRRYLHGKVRDEFSSRNDYSPERQQLRLPVRSEFLWAAVFCDLAHRRTDQLDMEPARGSIRPNPGY